MSMDTHRDVEMLLSQWVIPLFACFVSARLVACLPYPSTSTTSTRGMIADHGPLGPCTSISSECPGTNPTTTSSITICTTHANIPNTPPTRVAHAKRQNTHTKPSKPNLTRAQLIGLTVGVSIFAAIIGIGLFLWILHYFPLAQERFCACFCAVCCPWLVRRTRDFEWEWD
ncbi:hypothetical protein BJX68DRAFT_92222 [Aspergillus pseudodeflectus]|uniref:Uncharacterized protein n=1 Tax=Aspergillus pseudodeflectus TaxID=176178 RepID=A0ABR4KCI2_9EURO